MDPHEYIRSVIRAINRPGTTLDFSTAAGEGLKRVNPPLWELLPMHYTDSNVPDADVRDWILENWRNCEQPERT